TLLLLGAYHLLFAIWAICCPHNAFDLLGIPRPNHPTLWRVLGIIIGALGIALIIGAENPIRHWPIVLVLFIKSCLTISFIGLSILERQLPPATLVPLAFDSIIWLPLIAIILWRAVLAHTGIPLSRREPYSIPEAANTYLLSNGQTLYEASRKQPLVLVFLRHFGCTFTRQILRGLQDLEQQAKHNNASLVLVHMLQSGQEINYLGHNSDTPRIADPRCELYRSFGLGKGGFFELFGPQVWWRGAISVFKGCGVGHLAGDGLQMPGAFVFHNGRIISSQPAHSAADLPNLSALFKSTSP
ncbi:MAG: hypothetical protein H7Y36_07300, partial [Armatimonadetes bacterium]|nr:hypothetical protein [Akkermansiaceae bacterium]